MHNFLCGRYFTKLQCLAPEDVCFFRMVKTAQLLLKLPQAFKDNQSVILAI